MKLKEQVVDELQSLYLTILLSNVSTILFPYSLKTDGKGRLFRAAKVSV